MNENIDTLISATLDRQHLVAEINRATLSDLRRTVRRRRLRRWARVVAFAFTMPLIVFACAYLLYMYVLPAMHTFHRSVLLICESHSQLCSRVNVIKIHSPCLNSEDRLQNIYITNH